MPKDRPSLRRAGVALLAVTLVSGAMGWGVGTASRDPEAEAAAAGGPTAASEPVPPSTPRSLFAQLETIPAARFPDIMMALSELPNFKRVHVRALVIEHWTRHDPEAALAFIENRQDDWDHYAMRSRLQKTWAGTDFDAALAAAARANSRLFVTETIEATIEGRAEKHPHEAVRAFLDYGKGLDRNLDASALLKVLEKSAGAEFALKAAVEIDALPSAKSGRHYPYELEVRRRTGLVTADAAVSWVAKDPNVAIRFLQALKIADPVSALEAVREAAKIWEADARFAENRDRLLSDLQFLKRDIEQEIGGLESLLRHDEILSDAELWAVLEPVLSDDGFASVPIESDRLRALAETHPGNEALLRLIARDWASEGTPAEGMAWIAAQPEELQTSLRDTFFENLDVWDVWEIGASSREAINALPPSKWHADLLGGTSSPWPRLMDSARQWLSGQTAEQQQAYARQVVEQRGGPSNLARWYPEMFVTALNQPDATVATDGDFGTALVDTLKMWAEEDYDAAIGYLVEAPFSQTTPDATGALFFPEPVFDFGEPKPDDAIAFARTIPEENRSILVSRWLGRTDDATALRLIEETDLPPAIRGDLLQEVDRRIVKADE